MVSNHPSHVVSKSHDFYNKYNNQYQPYNNLRNSMVNENNHNSSIYNNMNNERNIGSYGANYEKMRKNQKKINFGTVGKISIKK